MVQHGGWAEMRGLEAERTFIKFNKAERNVKAVFHSLVLHF